jgi:hypothetical protein
MNGGEEEHIDFGKARRKEAIRETEMYMNK